MIIYSIFECFFVLLKNSDKPNLATVPEAHGERQSCENFLSSKLCDLSSRVPIRSLEMITGFFMLSPWKIVKVLNQWDLKDQIFTIHRKWNRSVFPLQLVYFNASSIAASARLLQVKTKIGLHKPTWRGQTRYTSAT